MRGEGRKVAEGAVSAETEEKKKKKFLFTAEQLLRRTSCGCRQCSQRRASAAGDGVSTSPRPRLSPRPQVVLRQVQVEAPRPQTCSAPASRRRSSNLLMVVACDGSRRSAAEACTRCRASARSSGRGRSSSTTTPSFEVVVARPLYSPTPRSWL